VLEAFWFADGPDLPRIRAMGIAWRMDGDSPSELAHLFVFSVVDGFELWPLIVGNAVTKLKNSIVFSRADRCYENKESSFRWIRFILGLPAARQAYLDLLSGNKLFDGLSTMHTQQ
jgi:hypothetical protein